ncbi:polysaccharide deacetylase family protein [Winogradskyella aquimaris]|uniref:Polysaccharide deacetylase family protein n=1 Tax=Winogradskyella aquimaris TaxID=864074 RepID=A0ABU5EIW5_9FLAO|nr:polysaccharide deacetylase family protein [Winogradskyella aquimaris]MDY2586269.1 polysaccharide deacetylase family protein [Winogradskyella aquimaris]
MKIIPAKTPGFVKSLFPKFVWNINTTNKELYLTFDDGPTPEITDWVLDTLTSFSAKATFFCIGKNIQSHPEIFNRIIKEGHGIGNHTFHHLKGWKTNTEAYITDVERTQELINSIIKTGGSTRTNLFRPPYGKFKSEQNKKLQELGYKIILWDVLSYDWDKTITEESCLKNIIPVAKQGSIIVFHDSVKAARNLRYALPKVLEYYSKKGYEFKALSKDILE